jgi:ubiquinol-cytochrome c reductase cytochrome b subunit
MSENRETHRPPGRRDPLGWLEQRINLSELFSFITHFGLVYTPVDTTRPIGEVLSRVSDEPVESYLHGPRVLGLLAAIVFLLQCVSGVMLAFYYLPTPEAAYDSTRTIVRDIPFGWFIHQMHTWGAWVLGAFVVLRLLRLFWDGVYRAPREVLWFCAVAMAWLVLQMDFTGRLMTWNTHSYWSVVRGTEVVYSLPLIGPLLAFLLGGSDVNQSTLIRFYVLHVMVLPLWFAIGIFLTFATLRRVGLSPGAPGAVRRTMTYRHHLYAIGILLLLITGVMATLTVLVPFRFAAAADPYTTPGGVRPPWYMLAPYTILQFVPLPRFITGGLLVLAAFAVLLLPVLEKRLGDFGRDEKRMRMAGVALLGAWIALSVLGAVLERR